MFFVAETTFGNYIVVPLKWVKDLKAENVFNYGTKLSKKTHTIFFSIEDENCANFRAAGARTANDVNCCFKGKIFDACGKCRFIKYQLEIFWS